MILIQTDTHNGFFLKLRTPLNRWKLSLIYLTFINITVCISAGWRLLYTRWKNLNKKICLGIEAVKIYNITKIAIAKVPINTNLSIHYHGNIHSPIQEIRFISLIVILLLTRTSTTLSRKYNQIRLLEIYAEEVLYVRLLQGIGWTF